MDLRLQKARVLMAFQPRRTIDSQNTRHLYGDIAWYGVLSGIAASFLSVFTIRLGGSDTHVGLLSSLPALAAILTSIPGSLLVEREKKPLSILVVTAVLNRFGYLAIALVPLLPLVLRADAIVMFVALLAIPGAIANVAFTTMFGQAVKPEHRARIVSLRNVWIGITSTTSALIGGKFLDMVSFPVNYQILFAVAFAASLMSVYHLARLRLPEEPSPASLRVGEPPRGVRSFIKMLRASRQYSKFTLISFIFHWGLFFPAPLYSIYWVRNLNATEGWIGLFNMIGTATTILFYPIWGRIAVRRGNQLLMFLSTLGLALYPLLTPWVPRLEWIIFLSFLGGVFTPAFGLSFFNGLLEVCPEQNRASHIAAYNTLVNIAAFLAPLISTSLTAVWGIHAMLIVGGMLRLAGSLLIWQQPVLAKKAATQN